MHRQNLAALTACRRIFSRRSSPTSFSSPPDWRPRVLPSDPPADLSTDIQAPSGFTGCPCPSPSGGVRCPGCPRSSDPGLASQTSLRYLPGSSSALPFDNRRRPSGSSLGFSGWVTLAGAPTGRLKFPLASCRPAFTCEPVVSRFLSGPSGLGLAAETGYPGSATFGEMLDSPSRSLGTRQRLYSLARNAVKKSISFLFSHIRGTLPRVSAPVSPPNRRPGSAAPGSQRVCRKPRRARFSGVCSTMQQGAVEQEFRRMFLTFPGQRGNRPAACRALLIPDLEAVKALAGGE